VLPSYDTIEDGSVTATGPVAENESVTRENPLVVWPEDVPVWSAMHDPGLSVSDPMVAMSVMAAVRRIPSFSIVTDPGIVTDASESAAPYWVAVRAKVPVTEIDP
jgi:hypothetical protein